MAVVFEKNDLIIASQPYLLHKKSRLHLQTALKFSI